MAARSKFIPTVTGLSTLFIGDEIQQIADWYGAALHRTGNLSKAPHSRRLHT
jgi:hypothetical protein